MVKADRRHVHSLDFHRRKAVAARTARMPYRSPRQNQVVRKDRDVEFLKKSVATLPDVRHYRVALLKQQIDFGTYRIDTELIAAKIIEYHP